MLGGKNSKNKHPRGYTIVEVMIVLAVSGVMFLIAADFINGKQEKTAFTEGVNATASQLQNTIEQVTDGQYSDIPLNCRFANGATTIGNTEPTGQGQNSSCVFLGKLWYFRDLRPTNAEHTYQVLSLAGGRVDSNGAIITNLTDAAPAVAGDLIVNQTINQSLDVTEIKYYDAGQSKYVSPDPSSPVLAFGFLQSQGSLDANGSVASGAQTVGLYYVPGSFNVADVRNLNPTEGVALCITDEQRYAWITVGVPIVETATGGNPLSVNVTMISPGKTCQDVA